MSKSDRPLSAVIPTGSKAFLWKVAGPEVLSAERGAITSPHPRKPPGRLAPPRTSHAAAYAQRSREAAPRPRLPTGRVPQNLCHPGSFKDI